jgi:hypothetical protein
MRSAFIACFLLILPLGSCEPAAPPPPQKSDGRVVQTLADLVQCKNEFGSTFSTLAASAQSLDVEQRLRLLLNAVERRRRCDDQAFDVLQAGLDADRRALER